MNIHRLPESYIRKVIFFQIVKQFIVDIKIEFGLVIEKIIKQITLEKDIEIKELEPEWSYKYIAILEKDYIEHDLMNEKEFVEVLLRRKCDSENNAEG